MVDLRSEAEIVIGTRGSALALYQARRVQGMLQQHGHLATVHIIQTTGDRVTDRFLHEIGGKGLFIKEIETALLEGKIDIGVHSLKDLPAKVAEDFSLVGYLKRDSPCDVFVQNPNKARIFPQVEQALTEQDFSGKGSMVVATGSLRRKALIENLGGDNTVIGIRGNVDTRVAKLRSSEWDAVILAQAALERLKMSERRLARALDPDWFVPSPGQGVIAVECLSSYPLKEQLQAQLDDPITRAMVEIERGVLADLGGDCRMPIGAYAAPVGEADEWNFRAIVLAPGIDAVRVTHQGQGIKKADIEKARREIYQKFIQADVNKAMNILGIAALTESYPWS